MFVQWTSKVCTFHISKIFLGYRYTLISLFLTICQVPIPAALKPMSTNRSELVEKECTSEQERIVGMLRTAEINCRRDMLWDQLLMWGAEDMESVAMAASISSKKGKKRDSTEEDDSQVTEL